MRWSALGYLELGREEKGNGERNDFRRRFGASRVDFLRGVGEGVAAVRFPHFDLDGEVLDDGGVPGNRRLGWSSGEEREKEQVDGKWSR